MTSLCSNSSECPQGMECINGFCVEPSPTPLPPNPQAMCSESQISTNKNWSAAVSALLFGALSSPSAYQLTNQIFEPLGLPLADEEGCPNVTGLLVHGLVYTAAVRFAMDHLPKCDYPKPHNDRDKWITSAMGGALFILVSSPFAYQITNSLVVAIAGQDNNIANEDGCPQLSGLILHTLVFGGVVRLMMRN